MDYEDYMKKLARKGDEDSDNIDEEFDINYNIKAKFKHFNTSYMMDHFG